MFEAYKLNKSIGGDFTYDRFTALLRSWDPRPEEAICSAELYVEEDVQQPSASSGPYNGTSTPVRRQMFKIVRTKDTGGREFLIDSGATYHMCNLEVLTPEEQSTVTLLSKPTRV